MKRRSVSWVGGPRAEGKWSPASKRAPCVPKSGDRVRLPLSTDVPQHCLGRVRRRVGSQLDLCAGRGSQGSKQTWWAEGMKRHYPEQECWWG